MKSGFIGIIGRPNVGKSTLLNAILGEKIAITTDKPQTTRNSIRGIYTRIEGQENDCQMIFIDTPGIHKPRTKLGGYMTEMAINTFRETEVVVFIVDDELSSGPGDQYIVELLRKVDTPIFLVINKIDKLDPEKYRKIYEEYMAFSAFSWKSLKLPKNVVWAT
jgi:GTP-binding protein Era